MTVSTMVMRAAMSPPAALEDVGQLGALNVIEEGVDVPNGLEHGFANLGGRPVDATQDGTERCVVEARPANGGREISAGIFHVAACLPQLLAKAIDLRNDGALLRGRSIDVTQGHKEAAATPSIVIVVVPTVGAATRLTSSDKTEDAKSECETDHCGFLSPAQDEERVLRNR
jgi:hypothetical protein